MKTQISAHYVVQISKTTWKIQISDACGAASVTSCDACGAAWLRTCKRHNLQNCKRHTGKLFWDRPLSDACGPVSVTVSRKKKVSKSKRKAGNQDQQDIGSRQSFCDACGPASVTLARKEKPASQVMLGGPWPEKL